MNIRAVFLHFLAADVRYIFALEENLPAVRLIKFENGSSERGFSATGLAHDAYRRSSFYRKTHVIDGFEISLGLAEQRFFYNEIFFKVFNFENILAVKLFFFYGFIHLSSPF